MKKVTIRIEINASSYEFEENADVWSALSPAEKDEVLADYEMEARERYCETRTSVTVIDPDGNEVEI